MMGESNTPSRPRIQQSWCPSCQEWTVLDAGRPCAFCETILVRKRGGYKRPDIQGRISEASARAIHEKYREGISARQLGKRLWKVLGYKSPHAAEFAIGRAFKRYGLPRRERIEATVLASTTKNGLSPRDDKERRRRRIEAGLTTALRPRRPRCRGVRQQYPRKGERCSRPAREGSEFCPAHDPVLAAKRDEHLARMRENSPTNRIHRERQAA